MSNVALTLLEEGLLSGSVLDDGTRGLVVGGGGGDGCQADGGEMQQ